MREGLGDPPHGRRMFCSSKTAQTHNSYCSLHSTTPEVATEKLRHSLMEKHISSENPSISNSNFSSGRRMQMQCSLCPLCLTSSASPDQLCPSEAFKASQLEVKIKM